MKSALLVLSTTCAILLVLSFPARDVQAVDYLGMMLNIGYYNLDHESYSKANYCFNKVLQNYPENPDALIGKATIQIKLQSYDKAIPYIDKVLKIYPHNFIAIYDKAVVLSDLGKYHYALFYYKEIQKMAPNFPLTEKDWKVIRGQFSDRP